MGFSQTVVTYPSLFFKKLNIKNKSHAIALQDYLRLL